MKNIIKSSLLFVFFIILAGCNNQNSYHIHSWDTGVVETKPTCTKNGVLAYSCADCSEKYYEIIPKSSHNWECKENLVVPTCKSEGAGFFACSNCDETNVFSLEKVDHSLYLFNKKEDSSCVSEGLGVYKCKWCNEYEIEKKIPISDKHNYDVDWAGEEDCSIQNVTYTCSLCGNSYSEEKEHHSYRRMIVFFTRQGYAGPLVVCSKCKQYDENQFAKDNEDENSDTGMFPVTTMLQWLKESYLIFNDMNECFTYCDENNLGRPMQFY